MLVTEPAPQSSENWWIWTSPHVKRSEGGGRKEGEEEVEKKKATEEMEYGFLVINRLL